MAILRSFMSLAFIAMFLELAMAKDYIVGAPDGIWDITTNLQAWSASNTFYVGDNLIFQYGPSHDVLEVSKTDYDSCLASSPIQAYSGGNTEIPLSSPGKRYFICGTPGHCGQGMKVEVDTLAASAPPPVSSLTPKTSAPPPVSSPTPKTSAPPPVSSPTPKTSASSPKTSPSQHASPVSSPTSSPSTSTSPIGSPQPSPASSANKNSFQICLTVRFSLVIIMVLAL